MYEKGCLSFNGGWFRRHAKMLGWVEGVALAPKACADPKLEGETRSDRVDGETSEGR